LVAIDITSLVDVVFLLLIFLLVTTTFKKDEHAFPITLPTSSHASVTVTTDKTTVFIDGEGTFHLLVIPADAPMGSVDETMAVPVTEEELRARLLAIHAKTPSTPIAIKGEKSTSYQDMVNVVSLLEDVGFRQIFFPYQLQENSAP